MSLLSSPLPLKSYEPLRRPKVNAVEDNIPLYRIFGHQSEKEQGKLSIHAEGIYEDVDERINHKCPEEDSQSYQKS